jgi:hypothetical protein
MAFFAGGQNKAEAILALAEAVGLDLSASTAYSDSATDLPMLELVGRPVAVNADRALAKLASERGWETCQFTKPVRLRDRAATRAPVVTSRPSQVRRSCSACGAAAGTPAASGPSGRRRWSLRGSALRRQVSLRRRDATTPTKTSRDDDGEDEELLHGRDANRPGGGPTAGCSDGQKVAGAGVRGGWRSFDIARASI